MKGSKNSEKPFSEYTFVLLKELYVKDAESFDDICKSDQYDIFRQNIEYPFIYFCRQISDKLPLQLTLQEEKNIYQPNHVNYFLIKKLLIKSKSDQSYKLCFQAYFSSCKFLYIRITQSGISLGRDEGVYQIILQKAIHKNQKAMIELIAEKPSILTPEQDVHFDKLEILHYWGFDKSVYKVATWLQQYLPLLILASSDNPMLIMHQYLLPLEKSDIESKIYLNGYEKTDIERWIRAINRKGQAIICGSPGTGKTFIAEKLAQHLIGRYGFSELVQFHPAYSYEDFIQGIRPQTEDGKLTYPLVPGRFLEFCKKAESYQDTCVLIIDEINRANLAQVFGELMYLLEYRDKEIPLAGGNTFRIPENVRIIGTMNTADRSITQFDYALRRRFAFIELRPNYDVLRQYPLKTAFPVEELIKILKSLNQAIADKNYEIGISFFLTDNLREDIEDIWRMEIEPYLEEYFFNDLDKVEEFRWKKVKQQL